MNQPYAINYCAAPAFYHQKRKNMIKCARARFGWTTGKKPVTLVFGYTPNK